MNKLIILAGRSTRLGRFALIAVAGALFAFSQLTPAVAGPGECSGVDDVETETETINDCFMEWLTAATDAVSPAEFVIEETRCTSVPGELPEIGVFIRANDPDFTEFQVSVQTVFTGPGSEDTREFTLLNEINMVSNPGGDPACFLSGEGQVLTPSAMRSCRKIVRRSIPWKLFCQGMSPG